MLTEKHVSAVFKQDSGSEMTTLHGLRDIAQICADCHRDNDAAPAVSKHQTLQAFANARPQLSEDIFVAPNSSLIGDVTLGKGSSVWYGAVLRGKCLMLGMLADLRGWTVVGKLVVFCAGDVNHIKVGHNSNIQDNVVVHVAKHNASNRALPTIIGNNVTIGTNIELPVLNDD